MGRKTIKNALRQRGIKPLTKEQINILNSYLDIVDGVLKLNKKQKSETIKAVRALFHTLTDEREEKKVEYLNESKNLCAYVYYYLWWNLYRMIRLFNSIPIELKNGDVVGDFGSGPFAFIMALWIAKPNLREKSIAFYCVDISYKAMKLGSSLFEALCNFTNNCSNSSKLNTRKDVEHSGSKWKIKRIVGKFGINIGEKLNFFVSANMFNELFWKRREKLNGDAKKYSKTILEYLKDDAKILIIEPGLPIGGEIVATFRQFLLEKGFSIISPCPHECVCSIHSNLRDGHAIAKGKWCHFSFSAMSAPNRLLRFSEDVHLAKKTVSLSYIYCSRVGKTNTSKTRHNIVEKEKKQIMGDNLIKAIITSNKIRLPNGKIGYYACSALGFLLVVGAEEKKALKSGEYIELENSSVVVSHRDRKSGAIIVEV